MSPTLPKAESRTRPADARLDSWKEIAQYLGREVRSVQRWEKSESLPVHRHTHRKSGSVYALKHELEEWRKSRTITHVKTSCSSDAFTGVASDGVGKDTRQRVSLIQRATWTWVDGDVQTVILCWPDSLQAPGATLLFRLPAPVSPGTNSGLIREAFNGG